MKRRGFLGLLGGAAVAGPGMAKEAIGLSATKLPDVSGGGAPFYVNNTDFGGFTGDWGKPNKDSATEYLARLMGKTADIIAKEKAAMYIDALDPDIAEMRSIRLHAKIRMQRNRQWQRMHDMDKDHLTNIISGLFPRA